MEEAGPGAGIWWLWLDGRLPHPYPRTRPDVSMDIWCVHLGDQRWTCPKEVGLPKTPFGSAYSFWTQKLAAQAEPNTRSPTSVLYVKPCLFHILQQNCKYDIVVIMLCTYAHQRGQSCSRTRPNIHWISIRTFTFTDFRTTCTQKRRRKLRILSAQCLPNLQGRILHVAPLICRFLWFLAIPWWLGLHYTCPLRATVATPDSTSILYLLWSSLVVVNKECS